MMNLMDTVDMMKSQDYKERFKAEYWQTKIRYEKLKDFNTKIEAAWRTADAYQCRHEVIKRIEAPKCDCPSEMLSQQQHIMGEYLHILEVRASIEGIDLKETCHEEGRLKLNGCMAK